MGRHRTSPTPRAEVLGWGLFTTALTCVLLVWRHRSWTTVTALGVLGVAVTVTVWVVEVRARGRGHEPDPDAAGPRLHDDPPPERF